MKNNDEINLIDLFRVVWKGKWKIISIIVILIIFVFYKNQSNTIKYFNALTTFSGIPKLEENKYTAFLGRFQPLEEEKMEEEKMEEEKMKKNSDNYISSFLNISKQQLLNLFTEILNERKVFEVAIDKYDLLNKSQYSNEQDYKKNIIKLASTIKVILPISKTNKINGGTEVSYRTIEFKYHDVEKWKAALIFISNQVNKILKKNLQDEFRRKIQIEKNKKKYKIEDLSKRIENLIIDFDRDSNDKILYLEEQSSIAKKLEIANNTIELQTFGNTNTLLSTIKVNPPFYLRGYEAIDKEIDLIKTRKNKLAFIKGLKELERKRRSYQQDKTLERLETIFLSTPLADDNNFYGATINVPSTKIIYLNRDQSLIFTSLIGLFIGIFYVLIQNAFKSQIIKKKK
jgi:LPS O-antigen subunit length determinant protein (WzzB/FepE family)